MKFLQIIMQTHISEIPIIVNCQLFFNIECINDDHSVDYLFARMDLEG